jgi:hypothetical protein
MIAPRQQRRASGRANRRGVEPVVADALVGYARKRGRANHAVVRVRQVKSHIVEQHNEDIERIFGLLIAFAELSQRQAANLP